MYSYIHINIIYHTSSGVYSRTYDIQYIFIYSYTNSRLYKSLSHPYFFYFCSNVLPFNSFLEISRISSTLLLPYISISSIFTLFCEKLLFSPKKKISIDTIYIVLGIRHQDNLRFLLNNNTLIDYDYANTILLIIIKRFPTLITSNDLERIIKKILLCQ